MDIILSGNIDRHNPKFFQFVMPKLKEFPYQRIRRKEFELLDKIILMHFGLANKFQLKDKFEGEAFYKNAACVYNSFLTICKILNLNFNSESLSIDLLNNPVIEINKRIYRIVNFPFGQMPRFVFDAKWVGDGLIFSMHRDEFSAYICGYIENQILMDKYESVKFDSTSTKSNVKEFIDFDGLKSLLDLKKQ